jgi:hypothetical protein
MADNISEPIPKPLITPLTGKVAFFINFNLSVMALLITLLVAQKYSFTQFLGLQQRSRESFNNESLIHRSLNTLIDAQHNLHPALLRLCQLTGIDTSEHMDLKTIVRKTQQHWLRKPGTERYELTDRDYTASQEQLLSLLASLNLIDTIEAKQAQTPYDTVLVHGAMAYSVRSRIQFLIAEYQRGIRFKQVVLLSGDRPLHPEKEIEYIKLGLKTEADMIEYLWETMPGLPESIKNAVHLIDAKGKTVQGHYKRPTTRDTIHQWLDELPPQAGHRCLAISNQPFVPFQDFVFFNILRERAEKINWKIHLETIGVALDSHKPIAVHLDNLARCLYELSRSIFKNPVVL